MILRQLITLSFLLPICVFGQVTISGKITNGKGDYLHIDKMTMNTVIQLDSVLITEKGKFKIDIPIDSLTFIAIGFEGERYGTFLFDKGEKIKLTADRNNFRYGAKVSGSKNSEITREFEVKVLKYAKMVDSTRAVFKSLDPEDGVTRSRTIENINNLIQEFEDYKIDFIEKHAGHPGVLITLSYLNGEQDAELYTKIADGLEKKIPNSEFYRAARKQADHFEAVKKKVEEEKKLREYYKTLLQPGTGVPPIALPNPEGDSMSLNQTLGKVTLIDFWASWCAPCRRENPNVVKLYEKYQQDGFTVFSVSLDSNKDRWKQAIEKDNLAWPYHVSELKGWGSQVVRDYNFNGIPFTVLIDKEGKVIGKGLRGPVLENQLKEIFGY